MNRKLIKNLMLVCAIILLLSLFNLPSGYYTFLRIAITIGAVIAFIADYRRKFNFWMISFGAVAIFFNPIIPIYLHSRHDWMVIDLIVTILFIVRAIKK